MIKRVWARLQGLFLVLLLVLSLHAPAAQAAIHRYEEGTDRFMVRSLQTLRDDGDQAWQLVLFKRVHAGETESLRLRLVGFPGVARLSRSVALEVMDDNDHRWSVLESLSGTPANPSVAEYEFSDVLAALDANTPLRLTIPTERRSRELVVPPFVIQEWREVANR